MLVTVLLLSTTVVVLVLGLCLVGASRSPHASRWTASLGSAALHFGGFLTVALASFCASRVMTEGLGQVAASGHDLGAKVAAILAAALGPLRTGLSCLAVVALVSLLLCIPRPTLVSLPVRGAVFAVLFAAVTVLATAAIQLLFRGANAAVSMATAVADTPALQPLGQTIARSLAGTSVFAGATAVAVLGVALVSGLSPPSHIGDASRFAFIPSAIVLLWSLFLVMRVHLAVTYLQQSAVTGRLLPHTF